MHLDPISQIAETAFGRSAVRDRTDDADQVAPGNHVVRGGHEMLKLEWDGDTYINEEGFDVAYDLLVEVFDVFFNHMRAGQGEKQWNKDWDELRNPVLNQIEESLKKGEVIK